MGFKTPRRFQAMLALDSRPEPSWRTLTRTLLAALAVQIINIINGLAAALSACVTTLQSAVASPGPARLQPESQARGVI
jgi:hypothetical protein